MKKRLLAALLALVMVLGMLPMAAFADEGTLDTSITVQEVGAIANTAAFLNYAHDYLGLAKSVTTVGNGSGNGTMYVKLSAPIPEGYSLYILVTSSNESNAVNAKFIDAPNSLAYWNNEAFENMDATYNVRVGMWDSSDGAQWSIDKTYFYIKGDDGTATWEKITEENQNRVAPIAVSPVPAFQNYTLAHWMNDFRKAHDGLKDSIDGSTLTLTAANLASLRGIVLNQGVFSAAADTTIEKYATDAQKTEVEAWKTLYTTTITKLAATGITTSSVKLAFTWLNCLPNLTEVDFGGSSALLDPAMNGILDPNWTSISKLTKLDLSGTGVKNIDALASAAELTDLNVSGNAELTSIAALAGPNPSGNGHTGLTKLAKLNISETGVADINALAFCTNLEDLNVSGCNITETKDGTGAVIAGGLTALASCTKLAKLDISGCTGVTSLVALNGRTTLAELDISRTGVKALNGLDTCTGLKKLTAKGLTGVNLMALATLVNGMTDTDISALATGAFNFDGTSKDSALTESDKLAVDRMIAKLSDKQIGLTKYYDVPTAAATLTVTSGDEEIEVVDGTPDGTDPHRTNYTVDLPYGQRTATITVNAAEQTNEANETYHYAVSKVWWWDHTASADVLKYDSADSTKGTLTDALAIEVPTGKTDASVVIAVRCTDTIPQAVNDSTLIVYAVRLRMGAPKYLGYTLDQWMTDFQAAYTALGIGSISNGTLTLTDSNRADFLKLYANRHVFDAIDDQVITTVATQAQKDQVAAWKTAIEAITKLDASQLTGENVLVGIGTLSILPNLTELDFSNNKISGADGVVPEDALWAQLTKLKLHNAGVKNIDQLVGAALLTELDLSGNTELTDISALAGVKDADGVHTGLTALKKLNISSTGVTDLNALAFCKLTNLTATDLTGLNVMGLASSVSKMTDAEIGALGTGAYDFTRTTMAAAAGLTTAEQYAVNRMIEKLQGTQTGLTPYTIAPVPVSAELTVTAGSTGVTLGTATEGVDGQGAKTYTYRGVEIPSNRTASIAVTAAANCAVTKVVWSGESSTVKYDLLNGTDDQKTSVALDAALKNITVPAEGMFVHIVVRPNDDVSENYVIYILGLTQGEAAQQPPAPPAATTPSAPTYKVNGSGSDENGSWSTDKTSAEEGETVTVTAKANEGYEVKSVTVTDKDGNEIAVTGAGDGKYTFTMPKGSVTVKVEFAEAAAAPAENPFTDVAEGDYYYDAVLWAVENGITNGTTDDTFSPKNVCTRAQAVTFLWRAAGSPAPTSTENPFTDVAEGDYYYEAVLWAVENGVTNGTSADKFSPNATVTRAQTVTFLYRAAKAQATEGEDPFADVAEGEYYYDAVLWAVENGITNGTSADKFSPAQGCVRAQMVTFLYRHYAE